MSISYPRGGAGSVKDKATLRYINQVADGLRSSTTTTIDSISSSIVPSVSSTFTYDSRTSGGLVDAKGEFSLRDSSNIEVVDGTDWSAITLIELFDTSEDDRDTEATANTIVANGTHIRLFSGDNNWAYYLITSVTISGDTIVLTVELVGSLGKIDSPLGSDKNIFIGFDIAVGQQGDNAISVNAVLTPSSISETDSGWPSNPITLSVIFGSGPNIQAVSLDTVSVATDGSLTPTTGNQSNVSLTLGTSSFQYDVTYSDSNRTATVRIETTAGVLIAEDVVTLALAQHGDKGDPGLDGTNGGFPVFQYKNATVLPATPTGGSYSVANATLTPSDGWTVTSSTPATGDSTFETVSFFQEDSSVEEVAEVGFIDFRNTPGTDIPGTKELMTVSGTNGVTGIVTTTPAVKEVTEILVAGTQTGTAGGEAAEAEKTDITLAGQSITNVTNNVYTLVFSGDWTSGTGSPYDNMNVYNAAGSISASFAGALNGGDFGVSAGTAYATAGVYTAEETAAAFRAGWGNSVGLGATSIEGWVVSGAGATVILTGPSNDTLSTDHYHTGTTGADLTTVMTTVTTETEFSIALDSSHGGPITGTFTSESDASSMATQMNTAAQAAITAVTVTGLTSSASGAVLSLDSTTVGDETNIAVTLTNPGTATATPTREQEGRDNTQTFATTGKLQASSNHNPNSSAEFTFANAEIRVDAANRIRNQAVTLDGYENITAVVAANASGVEAIVLGITAGDPIHKFSLTNTVGGADVDLVASLPIAGTGSDLVIKAVESTAGSDAFDTGTKTRWTAVIDGVSYTQLYSSGANASLQLSEPNAYLLLQGVDSSISGGLITKSATIGNKTPNPSFNITTDGTNQTATAPTVAITDGTDAKTTQDTIKFQLNGAPTSILEFPSGLTTSEAADAIENIFNSHVIFTHNDAFAINDFSLTPGYARVVYEYRNGGFIPTNLASNITITTGDTGGTFSLGDNPITTTQGVSTGGLSFWAIPLRKTAIDGLAAYNTPTVTVYQRKAGDAPTDRPNVVSEYTISTATLLFDDGTNTSTYSAIVSNNWHTQADAATGIEQLYTRTASVVTRDNTDTIAVNEWSGVVQAGSIGADGTNGLNNATRTYFQRTNFTTAPDKPSSETSYNFSTQVMLPTTNNSWQTFGTLSSTGKYLWATTATASSTTGTDVIPNTEWAEPIILSEDGDEGAAAVLSRTELLSGTSSFKNNNGSATWKAFLDIGGVTSSDKGESGSKINSYKWVVTPVNGVQNVITNGNVASLTGTSNNDTYKVGLTTDLFPHHTIIFEADGSALGSTTQGNAELSCEIDYTL